MGGIYLYHRLRTDVGCEYSFLSFEGKKKLLLIVTLFFKGYDNEYLVFYGDHPWHSRL